MQSACVDRLIAAVHGIMQRRAAAGAVNSDPTQRDAARLAGEHRREGTTRSSGHIMRWLTESAFWQ